MNIPATSHSPSADAAAPSRVWIATGLFALSMIVCLAAALLAISASEASLRSTLLSLVGVAYLASMLGAWGAAGWIDTHRPGLARSQDFIRSLRTLRVATPHAFDRLFASSRR